LKIYTKKGDQGKTGLLGGTRLPKNHIRIESYGSVDELNSYLGLLISFPPIDSYITSLKKIQDRLFIIGSHLAADPVKNKFILPEINQTDVEFIETEIDNMQKELTELKSFVLPGGSIENAHCHIARCVCRRAERNVVALSLSEKVEPVILVYLNRLSDYLFVLSRKILSEQQKPETLWTP
jgi:cob(I)alamin adenosyltransferase